MNLAFNTETKHEVLPVRYGSDEHKRRFCHALVDTFDSYQPSTFCWPRLETAATERLKSLGIWDIALLTEYRAGQSVSRYAKAIEDPILRQAIELNAFEEHRHYQLLTIFVENYGLAIGQQVKDDATKNAEWDFLITGYAECIDSFFAFGLFAAAAEAGFLPWELVTMFEPVMNDEARHIVFFVNWMAWHRRNMTWWQRPSFELKVLAVWLFLIYERIRMATNSTFDSLDNNFIARGSEALGLSRDRSSLMGLCLDENRRRLAVYDQCLKRPRFVPWLVSQLLRVEATFFKIRSCCKRACRLSNS
jgi:hypothetical protein